MNLSISLLFFFFDFKTCYLPNLSISLYFDFTAVSTAEKVLKRQNFTR